jgi:flagellar biosynthesis protein FlhA
MVVDTATAITTHLTEVIKNHVWELLTRTEVQSLLDNVSKKYPKLIDELVPSQLTLGGVQRVLQNLLREKVPIKDMVTILETLLDYASSTKDIELLTEYVRQALSRVITKQYLASDGSLYVMTLDPAFERLLLDSVEGGSVMEPRVINRLIRAMEKAFSSTDALKISYPIILCSTQVRRFLRRITERFLPSAVILSSAEIAPSVQPYIVGVVRYEDQEI